jgi:hypothetical protein
MFEHVQEWDRWVSRRERGIAALAAGYALVISVGVVGRHPEFGMVVAVLIPMSIIAAPALVTNLTAFRTACLAIAISVLVFGYILAIAAMFIYWPAAVPLVVAATPLADRHFWPTLMVTGVLLLALPLAGWWILWVR